MKSCCYGLLALLSCSIAAMPEADFEKLRGPLLKSASNNYNLAVQRADVLLQQHELALTLEQQIRLRYHKALFQHRSNQTYQALQTLADCKGLSLEATDKSILYSYHNILAGIFADQGLYPQALEHYHQALKLATLLPNPLFLRQTENNLALVQLKIGQIDEARSYFQRFYQQGLRDNSADLQAVALNNLGETALRANNIEEAERFHQQALALRVLHNLEASWSFFNLAQVALMQQDSARAVVLAKHSLSLRQSRHEQEQAEAGMLLAQAFSQLGDLQQADIQLQRSMRLAQRLQANVLLQKGWELQADLSLRQKKYAQAVVAMQQALLSQQRIVNQRFNLTVAQQSAELGITSREIEINQLQQQQQANQTRQQRFWLLLAVIVLVLLISIGFSLQIRRKNRALAHSLAELERTRQQLIEERKLAALTHLVSGMAHQLNTPVGTILTAVSCGTEQLELLAKKLADKQLNLQDLQQFIHEQRQLMTLAQQSTERTSSLVDRFKQISVQHQANCTDVTNIARYLQQWLQTHLTLQMRPAELSINTADLYWPVDVTLLGEVMTALLDNALQHAAPQQNQLKIAVNLEIQPDSSGTEQLCLSFCDNGVGIALELRDKIFDPFFTTKLGQSNLGLGLNIAYNQVQQLGGVLEYQHTQTGSCFSIRLPKQTQ